MRRIALACVFGLAALIGPFASADVKPNHLFSDHMVLQSGMSGAGLGNCFARGAGDRHTRRSEAVSRPALMGSGWSIYLPCRLAGRWR